MAEEDRDSTILRMIQNLNPIYNQENSEESERSPSDDSGPASSKRMRLDDSVADESYITLQGMTPITTSRPSLDMSYAASPREARRLYGDLIEARATISTLENRIKRLHAVRKDMQIMFDSETKGLNKQRDRDSKTIAELEKQVARIRKRESLLKEELTKIKHEFEDYKFDTEKTVNELESNIANLMEKLEDSDSMENAEITDLKRKVTNLEVIYEAAQKDVESHKELVLELEKQLNEKKAQERDFDVKEQALQRAQSKIKEIEFAKESYAEFQQQAKTQQHKLEMYNELERENQRLKEETKNLKEEVHNKLLLEEQVHNLTVRLQHYKEIDKKYAKMQMAHTQNENHLEEWRTVARSVCENVPNDSTLPIILRGQIERLQHQEITLTSAKVELESQISSLSLEARVAKAELKKNQKHMTDMQKSHQQTQNLIHRMQKKLLLVSRERDSYRQQLDSYERDLTMTIAPSGSNVQFQSQKERIEGLEKIVEGYREMIERMENDMKVAQPFTSGDIPVPIRSEQISRMQEQIEQLQGDNERLTQRKDQLEIQLEEQLLGQDTGDHRVIHMANNPLSECIEQNEAAIEKLKEDNERLRKKVRQLEEGLEASKLGDSSICPRELDALRQEKEKAERKVLRMKDIFKGSFQEFRDVIYMLFGYKVDKCPNSLFKLTSMYAENATDNICFQLNAANGELSVYETEFSATLEDKKELHLHHQNSIPVFLSAITIDLFSSRTNVV